jgi:hypothetical protein
MQHRPPCGLPDAIPSRPPPTSTPPTLLQAILEANAADIAEHSGKISDTLLQRLVLKPAKLAQLAEGIRAIAAQEEPVGRLLSRTEVSQGGWRSQAGAVLGGAPGTPGVSVPGCCGADAATRTGPLGAAAAWCAGELGQWAVGEWLWLPSMARVGPGSAQAIAAGAGLGSTCAAHTLAVHAACIGALSFVFLF